jgi:hypothetical protein
MIESNWTWRGETPSIEDLESTALGLLVELVTDKTDFGNIGTGGFRAYKFPWGIELTFSLERNGSF